MACKTHPAKLVKYSRNNHYRLLGPGIDPMRSAVLAFVLLLLHLDAVIGRLDPTCEAGSAQNKISGSVCAETTISPGTTTETDDDPSCPLWDYNFGWILSGRSIKRNEIIPGLIRDVMIPWKQHSTRAFPRWGRHLFFFRNPNAPKGDTSEFIFAPAYKYPLECHNLHSNLDVNYTDVFYNAFGSDNSADGVNEKSKNIVKLSPPIRSDRTIAVGDPIFLPCYDRTLSIQEDYKDFPNIGISASDLHEYSDFCVNEYKVYTKEIDGMSNGNQKYYGTFTKSDVKKGETIMWGMFIPMHRSELHNPTTNTDELLLNYCYSPSSKNHASSLLLLPVGPGVNGINHADRSKNQMPNIALTWMDPTFDAEEFFSSPTELLFGTKESTTPTLLINYTTLRDIAAGEELLFDYGEAWQNAWDLYVNESAKDESLEFRHPIGLPIDMIPTDWLESETTTPLPSYEWELPTLQAGEIKRLQLAGGIDDPETSTAMIHRVGLPKGLSEFMAKWADEIGITEVLRRHVRKELALPVDGERRLRLNGTTWWVKRFPEEWRSDMHYISPDDYESNQMFMNALADAGFDTVINAVGMRDNLTSVTVYYPSYIAVSHCTESHMHNDAEEHGHFNVIFPVVQVNNSKPELIVGDEFTQVFAPYKYEPDHAVVLGPYGHHGTAPCDYRDTDSIRMVVSIYMVDSDNVPTRTKVLNDWVDADPPYPRVKDREEFLKNTKHWKRNDPTRSLRNPLAPGVVGNKNDQNDDENVLNPLASVKENNNDDDYSEQNYDNDNAYYEYE